MASLTNGGFAAIFLSGMNPAPGQERARGFDSKRKDRGKCEHRKKSILQDISDSTENRSSLSSLSEA